MSTFTGFTPDAIQFMADLAQNNDRAWFQPRKADFERLLKEPMEAMIAALADAFVAHGVPMLADPKRSPFRIYRDVRFSKDKAPYKTHLGATFPWTGGSGGSGGSGGADVEAGGGHDERAHGNGGYFHFQPGEMYAGGGMWRMEKDKLDAFRRTVLEEPETVRAALYEPAFVAEWGGPEAHEHLQRVPPGFPKDHPLADMFRWKDVVFGKRLSDEDVLSADLPDRLAASYAKAAAVYRFLAAL